MDPMISGVLDILQQNHHQTEPFNDSNHPIHLYMFLTRNVIEYLGECLINFMDLYFEFIIQLFICGNVSRGELLANQLLEDMEQISEESFILLENMLNEIYIFGIDFQDEFITSKQKLSKLINLIFGVIYFNKGNETKYLQYMERVYSDEIIERKILRVIFLNRIGDFEKAYEVVKGLIHFHDFYKYLDEYCKTMIGLNRTEELFQDLEPIVSVKIQESDARTFVQENFGVIYCLYLSASLSGRLNELEHLNKYNVEYAACFSNKLKILKCYAKFQISMSYGFLEQMNRSSFVLLNSYCLSMFDSNNQFMQQSKEHTKVIHGDQLKLFVNMYSTTSFRFQVDFDFSKLISNEAILTEFKYSYNPKNLSLLYDPENSPEREIYSDNTTKVFANLDSVYICKPDDCWAKEMPTEYGSQIICYKNHLLLKKDFSIKSVSFNNGKEKKLKLSNCRSLDVKYDTENWISFLFNREDENLIALGQDCGPSIIASSLHGVDIVSFEEIEDGIACYLAIERLPSRTSNICKYYISVENGHLHQRKVLFSDDNHFSIDFYHEKEKIIGYSCPEHLQFYNVNTNKLLYQTTVKSLYLLDQFQDMILIASDVEKRLMVFNLSKDSVKVLVDLSYKNSPSIVLGRFCGSRSFIIEREDTTLYEYSLSNGECLAVYPFKINFTTSVEYFEHSPSQKRFLLVLELDCIHLIELSSI
ncbi:predicted protein [Naegleria gruberi]|uniref:Predicted protein n=1 Tax=Naegleria gruberi TaxID=5762 RepID=D2VNS2_NAEGR|nr:uncharacterized protein NAEGRDRAFT_70599 [Naegleria gruberi]EFC41462.1 predicted protein [Naegleria gruberi]|eukprot:XP_002674206.1 predicted protein [Naegleria gruberi strain NEG-M]